MQLVIDDNVEFSDGVFKIYHNGRITVGNKGAGKINELKRLILQRNDTLLKGTKVYIGSIKNDHLLYMNDKDITFFIQRLIEYALIRDEYRELKKSTNE